ASVPCFSAGSARAKRGSRRLQTGVGQRSSREVDPVPLDRLTAPCRDRLPRQHAAVPFDDLHGGQVVGIDGESHAREATAPSFRQNQTEGGRSETPTARGRSY